MLYLRRCIGEKLVVFDTKSEYWLTLTEMNRAESYITLKISGQTDPLRIFKGTTESFPLGKLSLSQFYSFDRYPDAAGIGVEVAPNVQVHRAEKLVGLDRSQRISMARAEARRPRVA